MLKKISSYILSSRWNYALLLLVALISYGQVLGMNFWQDDNALVFKFTHIYEQAGYLGRGVLGEGAYRYTITPYLPIFYLFGYNPVPYFAFALGFFALSVYAVYFFYLTIFGHRVKARIAGLLYAAGYIASDGFIRLFNSVLTSLSVILTCATIGLYYKYFKTRQILWYILSIVAFLAATETGFIRAHYLFFVVAALEILFLFGKFSSLMGFGRSLLVSSLRLLPFAYIFYKWYLTGADSRSGQVVVLVKSLLRGEFQNTYSFFATLGNMLLPNEVFPKFYSFLQDFLNTPLSEKKVVFALIIISAIGILSLVKTKILSWKFATFFFFIIALILPLAQRVFSHPGLIGGFNEKMSLYVGILFILGSLAFVRMLSKKRLGLLLLIWLVLNLAAYAAYIPIYAYPSDNRYLLHSFIPLVGLFSLWSYDLSAKIASSRFKWLPFGLVLLWGGLNLFSNISWQHKIVLHRANPSKRFFAELKNYYQTFPKGSILYFIVPDKPFAQAHYDASFSVAQMPEETAIAWRYGIDRYDLSIVNSFEDLKIKTAGNKTPVDNIYTFIADPDKLIDVTQKTRDLLVHGATEVELLNDRSETVVKGKEDGDIFKINSVMLHPKSISTLTPVKLTVRLKAEPLLPSGINFPITQEGTRTSLSDEGLRSHYLDFRQWEKLFYKIASVSATSTWKSFPPRFLLDRDNTTYWEADRIAWDSLSEGFTVDLGQVVSVGGIFYRNGPHSLTPTQFEVLLSKDGNSFEKASDVMADLSQRDETKKVTFPDGDARYVRVIFHKTLYGDSPGVSEVQVIPTEFADIDPIAAQNFFRTPFSRVESDKQWLQLIDAFRENGLIRFSWKSDASDKVVTTAHATIPVRYNGKSQEVSIEIPAGGEVLEYLEIEPLTVPGTVTIEKITYQNIPLSIDK
ncbi:MAG: discoidin domain-containing protein [bacterium]|nr:discoidin domain-containing protein [bacterium]